MISKYNFHPKQATTSLESGTVGELRAEADETESLELPL